jgi:hypothetical protein
MESLSAAFQHFKLWLIGGTGLSKDALHVYAGLTVFLTVYCLWRGRRRAAAAWLAALAVALTAEAIDVAGEGLRGALQPDAAHWHDIWNSMVWPSVLSLLWRWRRFRPAAASGEDAERRLEQA